MNIESDLENTEHGIIGELSDAKRDHECAWQEDVHTGSWDTACGNKFEFTNDGPEENGFHYCPYCGGRLIGQKMWEETKKIIRGDSV